jgi:hypothetical protein
MARAKQPDDLNAALAAGDIDATEFHRRIAERAAAATTAEGRGRTSGAGGLADVTTSDTSA